MAARTSLALLAVAAVALVGCGAAGSSDDSTDKFQGEQRLVANTVEDLESAASGDGDQDKICRELLTQELARAMAGGGRTCQAAVDVALENADQIELEVQQVDVASGNRTATARVAFDRGDSPDEVVRLGLTKQGAGWRISDLGS